MNTIRIINAASIQTAKLLLWIFAFYFSSCDTLKSNRRIVETAQPVLQVAVGELDLPSFIESIQDLKHAIVDVKLRLSNSQNMTTKKFWISFRFTTKNDFLRGRSEILSTGLVTQIN